eukprot:14114378-Heterocapsa_arctica.AAC.1
MKAIGPRPVAASGGGLALPSYSHASKMSSGRIVPLGNPCATRTSLGRIVQRSHTHASRSATYGSLWGLYLTLPMATRLDGTYQASTARSAPRSGEPGAQ